MKPEENEKARNRNNALLITNQTEQIRKLTIERDAWRLTAKAFSRALEQASPDGVCVHDEQADK